MVAADKWHTFQSSWGWMATAWRGEILFALTFGHRRKADALEWLGGQAGGAELTDAVRLEQRLRSYVSGDLEQLDDVAVDIADRTPFQQSVLRTCRRITCGMTWTYGELAMRSGYPGAARAVGNVMRSNRHPLIIPCHRVVGASGKLVGYSAPGGLVKKEELLAREDLTRGNAGTCQRKGKH